MIGATMRLPTNFAPLRPQPGGEFERGLQSLVLEVAAIHDLPGLAAQDMELLAQARRAVGVGQGEQFARRFEIGKARRVVDGGGDRDIGIQGKEGVPGGMEGPDGGLGRKRHREKAAARAGLRSVGDPDRHAGPDVVRAVVEQRQERLVEEDSALGGCFLPDPLEGALDPFGAVAALRLAAAHRAGDRGEGAEKGARNVDGDRRHQQGAQRVVRQRHRAEHVPPAPCARRSIPARSVDRAAGRGAGPCRPRLPASRRRRCSRQTRPVLVPVGDASSTFWRTLAAHTAARDAPPETATMIGRTGPSLGAQAVAHALKSTPRSSRCATSLDGMARTV